ncbi:MAG: PilZ domain-containing protein [Xanthobacteraceae bacterium]
MIEKREAPRRKCFLRAFVYFEGRETAVDCVVRDISDIGARLQFGKPIDLSELLDLHIPIKGQSFHAEKRWHNGDEIGVAFNAAAKANTGDTGADRRVARLQAEIAVLKKAIRHLQKNDDQDMEVV